jgi:pSer/pThr/pTyr-binding forkhead associated (FHA) protein
MTKRLLVIDGDDQGPFFLSVEEGTMTLGGDPANAEAVLRGLHITRIHCEVEVDEDLVVVGNPKTETGEGAFRQELHPGEDFHLGHAHLRLGGAVGSAPAAGPQGETAPSEGRPIRRLLVIDGADRGRFFPLPETGSLTIGKSHKSCDIILHDLYVARVHCQLRMEGEQVIVTHLEGDNGTLINGQRITEQELHLGEVLRVGNEHLRLELAMPKEEGASADVEDVEAVPVASEEGTYDVSEGEEEVDLEIVEDDEEVIEVIEEDVELVAEEVGPETAPAGVGAFSLPHPPVDQLLRLEDQVFGHYQIGPLLGRGQSGVVFRALDSRTKQTVALKVLSPDFPDSDAELQRFVRALKSLPQLLHANLVTPCGAGKTGPYCWIAREYVEGESVARLIQRLESGGKFEWTRACRIAIHLGKALDFLHQHNVTHGNITPRNILVRGSDRAIKLTDLMLNRALEGSRLQKAILGKKLLAELPYLAPEQTDPHAPVAPLADLYAVGVVAYALLTGQPPFLAASPREIVALIRQGKVLKPSKFRPGIPVAFESAVLKMMARHRKDRFQSAPEMLAALEPIAKEHDVKL